MRTMGILSLLLVAGCSSTFDRDWESATGPLRSADVLPSGLEGNWEGRWISDENGHEGALRCILRRGEGSAYNARYHATYSWYGIPFSFEYEVPMAVVRAGDAWTFRGSAELSCWVAGGCYDYEGRAERDDYVATYRSDFDRGVFRMRRVK